MICPAWPGPTGDADKLLSLSMEREVPPAPPPPPPPPKPLPPPPSPPATPPPPPRLRRRRNPCRHRRRPLPSPSQWAILHRGPRPPLPGGPDRVIGAARSAGAESSAAAPAPAAAGDEQQTAVAFYLVAPPPKPRHRCTSSRSLLTTDEISRSANRLRGRPARDLCRCRTGEWVRHGRKKAMRFSLLSPSLSGEQQRARHLSSGATATTQAGQALSAGPGPRYD